MTQQTYGTVPRAPNGELMADSFTKLILGFFLGTGVGQTAFLCGLPCVALTYLPISKLKRSLRKDDRQFFTVGLGVMLLLAPSAMYFNVRGFLLLYNQEPVKEGFVSLVKQSAAFSGVLGAVLAVLF